MAGIERVLVANRGEIARRIVRAAHGLGMAAVAVHAADDDAAPHVAEADAAVALAAAGPAAYLDVDALVAAARAAGADALHPGYGFASEDPRLAEACGAAGITWVGPPPAAMAAMGHKARARDLVAAAGVPVLEGRTVPEGEDQAAAGAAVGYPLLVKASAGGGGRGMRLVDGASGLAASVDAARREAASAFGSGDVFVERYLAAPRHVEVQVLGDAHGRLLHLFDRECSVQRRHQKVVEEAPAAVVPGAVRRRMWDAALAAAAAVGYVGAGTVEFLVDGEDCFFLEMNTRLQVEHGVTELVTGLDLVQLQLRIAGGEPLALTQDDVVARGHAVELRLCAEVPAEEYRPAPGPVHHVRWPDGDGVRVDAAVESGSSVSPAYDSLVAKLMAWGPDRATALRRARRALDRLEFDGPATNRLLLGAVLDHPDLRSGAVTTGFLGDHPEVVAARTPDRLRARRAAAAAVAMEGVRAGAALVPAAPPSWRNVGTAGHADLLDDGHGPQRAVVRRTRHGVEVVVDGAPPFAARREGDGTVVVEDGGVAVRHRVRWAGPLVAVNDAEGQSTFATPVEGSAAGAAGAAGECRAPLPGAVLRVLVAEGDAVEEGTALAVVEAMKMEHTLRAAGPGTVTDVRVAAGAQVDMGDLLVVVAPS